MSNSCFVIIESCYSQRSYVFFLDIMWTKSEDSCLAWLVCMGAFITLAGVIGIDNSFGIVIDVIITQFDSSTSRVSWIQSTHSTFMFLFAFISSVVLKKCGLRVIILNGTLICCTSYIVCAFFKNYVVLIIFYGIAGGVGSGLLFTAGNIACFKYFKTYETLASGIAMSGTGFGMIMISLACSFAVINFGYIGYFITLSIISSLSSLFALFAFELRSDNQDTNEEQMDRVVNPSLTSLPSLRSKSVPARNRSYESLDSVSFKDESVSMKKCEQQANFQEATMKKVVLLMKDKRLFCYCLVHVLFELAYYVPVNFLPEMMKDNGTSKQQANTIISLIGIFILVSKWIVALILRYFKPNPILLSSITMTLLGACYVLYPLCSTYKCYVAVTLIYGISISSIDMLIPFIILNLFDAKRLDEGFGLIMLTKALFPLWGSPISGALRDWTGNYDLAFYTAGCALFIGGFINVMIYFLPSKTIETDTIEDN